MTLDCDTLIVGAGPAGLATAACLAQRERRSQVIEQADELASSWRSHYDRLHLHTVKTHSALPGMPFPAAWPRYVPRQGLIDYLEAYAARFDIRPVTGQQAVAITTLPDGSWQTRTAAGRVWTSRRVVLATGANHTPRMPVFPGQDRFAGRILHSRDYRHPQPFAGQRVLVVGMGNTGAEIALDLAEHGVRTALAVRSPVNIVLRDVAGRPTQLSSLALARLPASLGDAIASLLRDLTVGDLSRWGLRTARMSPLQQLREQGKTPVIDVGTLARIRSGEIEVHPGIDRFIPTGVVFSDGSQADVDSVILATGYSAGLAGLLPDTQLPLDASGLPAELIGRGRLAGIYCVGFDIRSPGGLLRTIALQAERVADDIAGR